jgi:Xaa-Pro aminopeptidase
MASFPWRPARTGVMGVDWENRVDFERLRQYRIGRVRQMLEQFDLGAVLLFETSNIRYATATQIGYWAFNKGERWALVTRNGRPRVWDFGSAAKAHRLQLPHMYDTENSIGGNTGLQGAIGPETGLHAGRCARSRVRWRTKVSPGEARRRPRRDGGVPRAAGRGLDIVDGQQAMMRAREIKNPDEIMLLTQACAMVDGVYQDIFEALKPGVRESDIVGLAHKRLFEMGSEFVEAINSIAGERCSPTPRVLRPADPARRPGLLRHHPRLQRLPHLLLPDLRGRARHAGPARRLQAVPRVDGCRHRPGEAGATTDQIAKVWPRPRSSDSRTRWTPSASSSATGSGSASTSGRSSAAQLAGDPVEIEEGMVFALETYAPPPTGGRPPGSRRRWSSPPTAARSSPSSRARS